jgi:hypothetical protein
MRTLLCWLLLIGTAQAGSVAWDYDLTKGEIPPTSTMQRGPTATGPFTNLATVPSLPSLYVEPPAPAGWVSVYYRLHNDGGDSNVYGYVLPVVTPPPSTITLTVVGDPATGPWGVTATTTDTRDVMAQVRLDGLTKYIENFAPYDFAPGLYGAGSHLVEFIFYLQDTTTEIGRASVTVTEGSVTPPPPTTTIDTRVTALEAAVLALTTVNTQLTGRVTAAESKLAGVCRAAKAMGGSSTSLAGRLRAQMPCP